MSYDPNNVFAKILANKIPCHTVYEDDYVLAFHDIRPRTKIHVLVIPKKPYVSSIDFHAEASDQEIVGYYRGLDKVIALLNLKDSGGFRLLSNCGKLSNQEVPHFHTHIFAGQSLGPMVCVPREE